MEFGCIDYPLIIAEPIDLSVVQVFCELLYAVAFFVYLQRRLEEGRYRNVQEFVADVRRVFANALEYDRTRTDHDPSSIYCRTLCWLMDTFDVRFHATFPEIRHNSKEAKRCSNGQEDRVPKHTPSPFWGVATKVS